MYAFTGDAWSDLSAAFDIGGEAFGGWCGEMGGGGMVGEDGSVAVVTAEDTFADVIGHVGQEGTLWGGKGNIVMFFGVSWEVLLSEFSPI